MQNELNLPSASSSEESFHTALDETPSDSQSSYSTTDSSSYDSSSYDSTDESTDENTDMNGYYNISKDEILNDRYRFIRKLGMGVYSNVIAAHDIDEDRLVAVKICRRNDCCINYAEEEYVLTRCIYDTYDSDGANPILEVMDGFIYKKHPCIVTELLGSDLRSALKAAAIHGYFDIPKVKRIVTSLLTTLDHLYDLQIVHADLKPCNIAILNEEKGLVKVLDYGLSCLQEHCSGVNQTLSYRAPEVILRRKPTVSIDIWSLGGIAVELFLGRPLFLGLNEEEQLAAIIEVLGEPPFSVIEGSRVRSRYFNQSGHPFYCRRLPMYGLLNRFTQTNYGLPGSRPLDQLLLGSQDDLYIDFVKRCLDWDPNSRMTPPQALMHPWITNGE